MVEGSEVIKEDDNMTEPRLESFDLRQMKLWKQDILSIYDRFKDVFEDEGFLEEFTKILNIANDTLVIIDRYELPDVVIRTFIEDFYDRLEGFRRGYRRYIGRVIEHVCDELRRIVEESIEEPEEVEG
jgi:hypothetical protein